MANARDRFEISLTIGYRSLKKYPHERQHSRHTGNVMEIDRIVLEKRFKAPNGSDNLGNQNLLPVKKEKDLRNNTQSIHGSEAIEEAANSVTSTAWRWTGAVTTGGLPSC